MNILDFLNKEAIISELESRSKKEVLEELTIPLVDLSGIDKDILVQALMEREQLGSTGYENGVGFPHTKLKNLDSTVLGFGLSKKGVDFDSIDGLPTHIFFLLLTPENSAGVHLKLLATISKFLKDELVRKQLIEADSREAILSIIGKADENNN